MHIFVAPMDIADLKSNGNICHLKAKDGWMGFEGTKFAGMR
jgi:hypothetical protein